MSNTKPTPLWKDIAAEVSNQGKSMQIQVEESALDSIKRMAQQLQDERDELLAALKDIQQRAVLDRVLEKVVNDAIAKAESNA